VAVAVHTAAPLGKTGPEEVFRKKVRADRDRRRRRTPITVTIDNVSCSKQFGRRSEGVTET
jgi:hypothetical protein